MSANLYDGFGRRGSKTRPLYNGETLYFYDQSGRLLTEMILDGGGGGVGKDYLYLPDGPVARLDWTVPPCFQPPPGMDPLACIQPDERLLYYHDDHLGTPIAMTDIDAEIQWRAEYLPFGELFSVEMLGAENNLRFPGQYFDDETGLHQNWFRDYDPKTGRYVEADPIGLFADLNPFAYASSNPVVITDPAGLWGIKFGWRGVNLGIGEPTLLFSEASWTDLESGAYATLDGLIPFGDPLKGNYDYCDENLQLSKNLGEVSQGLLLSAVPFRPFTAPIQRIAHWGPRPARIYAIPARLKWTSFQGARHVIEQHGHPRRQ